MLVVVIQVRVKTEEPVTILERVVTNAFATHSPAQTVKLVSFAISNEIVEIQWQ